jgi:hypothetical protein
MKAVALIALLSGCFGYDPGAKKWAYVGDTLLIVGGGAAIGADLATRPAACSGPTCTYQAPIDGGLVAGVVLVTAGVVGIIYNATRAPVKTSR